MAAGQFERLPRLATDLVGRRPAIIATQTLPAALAAKASTDTIPIVFVIGEDPIKVGLVASLSRPAGNVTGISNFMNVLGAKRLELVSEAVPKDARLALLVNPNNPNAGPDTNDLQTAAAALGRHLEYFRPVASERPKPPLPPLLSEKWALCLSTPIRSSSSSASNSLHSRLVIEFRQSIPFERWSWREG